MRTVRPLLLVFAALLWALAGCATDGAGMTDTEGRNIAAVLRSLP